MIVATVATLVLFASPQATAPTGPANPQSPPALASTATTGTPPAAAAAEQICRRQPIEGSRRQERVCHTKAEWDLIRDNARNNRDSASRDQRGG